jgi:hypothetical protein
LTAPTLGSCFERVRRTVAASATRLFRVAGRRVAPEGFGNRYRTDSSGNDRVRSRSELDPSTAIAGCNTIQRVDSTLLARESHLFGHTRGYSHDFTAQVYPEGTQDHRQHACDFDLTCLAQFGGCRGICELMPSAWVDYQKEAQKKGWEAALPGC